MELAWNNMQRFFLNTQFKIKTKQISTQKPEGTIPEEKKPAPMRDNNAGRRRRTGRPRSASVPSPRRDASRRCENP